MSALIRPLLARDPDEHHRAATTLELFFDLVSVIAIAAVTAGFHHAISEGHGLEALPKFIFLFLAVWWAWMNLTWFTSAFDNGDKLFKILVMLIIGGELLFAGGAEFIFATMDFSFGLLGWVVMRLGMVSLWLRAAHTNPEYRGTALRYAAGISIAQICWCLLYFGTEPGSLVFFLGGAACFLVEWSVPPIAESHRQTPFHRHHIIERYGLLMIISLGELVLSISHGYSALFSDHPSVEAAVVSTAALVIVFAIWEVYFWEPEHLPSRKISTAVMWGYVHVLIFGATAALGAAIAASIDVATHHSHTTQAAVSLYFGAAFAVWMLALWVVRDRILPLARAQALCLPVMAALTLLAGIFGAPVWGFAVLAVIMVIWRTARQPVELATH
jgi:low temperature requirement protein LtrA